MCIFVTFYKLSCFFCYFEIFFVILPTYTLMYTRKVIAT